MPSKPWSVCAAVALFLAPLPSFSQVSQDTLNSISTPESVDARISTLSSTDGAPSADTAPAVYDNPDSTFAFRAFTDAF